MGERDGSLVGPPSSRVRPSMGKAVAHRSVKAEIARVFSEAKYTGDSTHTARLPSYTSRSRLSVARFAKPGATPVGVCGASCPGGGFRST